MRTAIAAFIFLAVTSVTVVFQLALAAGAPWGKLTWGGKFAGRLPPSMRAVAMFSALLLAAFGMVVAIRAGLVARQWARPSRTLIWVVVLYCVVGAIANAVTPSRWERRIWLPVVLVMLATVVVVAVS
jgi:hypothetical protein